MIRIRYRVGPSQIANSGLGFYTEQSLRPGQVLIAPDGDQELLDTETLMALPEDDPRVRCSVRWFEDCIAVAPDWPDEDRINHSFEPNSLWHLGFVFAIRPIASGAEITLDYRYLLAEGCDPGFIDSTSGRAIVGYAWSEAMRLSLAELSRVFSGSRG